MENKKYCKIVYSQYMNIEIGKNNEGETQFVKGSVKFYCENVYEEKLARVVCNALNDNNKNLGTIYSLEEVVVPEEGTDA